MSFVVKKQNLNTGFELRKSYTAELKNNVIVVQNEMKIHNTICSATYERQESAKELAFNVECMVVVGGKNSSNTTKLAEICKNINDKTIHIETV